MYLSHARLLHALCRHIGDPRAHLLAHALVRHADHLRRVTVVNRVTLLAVGQKYDSTEHLDYDSHNCDLIDNCTVYANNSESNESSNYLLPPICTLSLSD